MSSIFIIISSRKISLTRIFFLQLIVAIACSLSTLTAYAEIKTNQGTSTVGFSGQHAGMDFDGKFERWQATLILPPADNPNITAVFYMSSAKTGDSIYDSTLPEFDWFDVENHARGKFLSANITITQEGYQVTGDLTLKDITKPVSFMLKENDGQLKAKFDINRLDYQIGFESDPDAEWVSKTISMYMVINP